MYKHISLTADLAVIGHDEICELIPHAGKMCLLDAVKSWDEKSIICTTNTHQKASNPLRNREGLPMLSLVEYGAQAVAVHGALLAKKESMVMEEGYLAALRDVQLAQGCLSDIANELEVGAERIYVDAGNMIYTMVVRNRNKVLVNARVTVVAKFRNNVSKS